MRYRLPCRRSRVEPLQPLEESPAQVGFLTPGNERGLDTGGRVKPRVKILQSPGSRLNLTAEHGSYGTEGREFESLRGALRNPLETAGSCARDVLVKRSKTRV
jgi:hypothetical protein